jgi:purine-cytosine permease-like protein
VSRGWFKPPEVEAYGVDRIAETERTATPWSFVFIAMGNNMSLGVVLFGWIPITLGLGLWDSITSILVGTAVGVFILAPLIAIGSRTATNNSTSSGAHFGVRGRLIGSFVGLAIAIVYTAIAVWTGADAILGSLHRLFGTPDSTLLRGIAYAVLTVLITLVAIYGFKLLLRFETTLLVVGGGLILLMLVALSGKFTTDYAGGEYLLAGRWETWTLSALAVGVAGPLAMVGLTGDWARYVSPSRYSTKRLVPMGMLGVYLGIVIPQLIGTMAAVTFADPYAPFVDGLIAASPGWYVVCILLLGILGSGGLAVGTSYSCGLDLDAIVPRLTRVQATIATSMVAAALVYLGALVFNLADSVLAISIVLLALSTPWAVITGLGYLLCRGRYDLDALQVFNRGERGGLYWFAAGFNYRAVVAFLAGATFGILAVNTTLYVGPLANVAGGVDVSFAGAALIAGTVYLVLRAVFPERLGELPPAPVPGAASRAVQQTPAEGSRPAESA